MGACEAIRDVLAGDATLAALLVGGMYTFAETGRSGISRASLADAFASAGGFLQPCAVIKAGEVTASEAIRDSAAGSVRRVEVYLYDDGDASGSDYMTINAARDRAVGLLDHVWIEGAGWLRLVGGADEGRDPKLNGAAVVRVDFEVKG